jgi:riboflavin transporter FmnP
MATQQIKTDKNTNTKKGAGRRTRWSARQLATMALFIAIGVILSFIEFPLIPGVDFLKYDASAVAALLSGFAYGPVAGCVVGVLIALIHAFDGNIWGGIMNSGIIIAYVLPASLVYTYAIKRRRKKALLDQSDDLTSSPSNPTKPKTLVDNIILIAGLIISCALMVVVAIGMNLVVTPLYMSVPREAVIALLIPAIIPFNLVKSIINSFLGFVLLKSLGRFLE